MLKKLFLLTTLGFCSVNAMELEKAPAQPNQADSDKKETVALIKLF